jgi:hypothetical protein
MGIFGVEVVMSKWKEVLDSAEPLNPVQIRALVVERLLQHAVDEDISPAQRLKALGMLGKVTEVGAFTERKQVEHVKDPGVVKDELISALRAALKNPQKALEGLRREENRDVVIDPPPPEKVADEDPTPSDK